MSKRERDRRYDAQRRVTQPWRQWYGLKVWRDLRTMRLAEDPLCQMCLADGRVTPATVVDHKQDHKGDWSMFIDYANTQSLCDPHHNSTKQKQTCNGFELGTNADGTPKDKSHHWN